MHYTDAPVQCLAWQSPIPVHARAKHVQSAMRCTFGAGFGVGSTGYLPLLLAVQQQANRFTSYNGMDRRLEYQCTQVVQAAGWWMSAISAPVQIFGTMLCTAVDRLLKSLTVKKNWPRLATARSSVGFSVASGACETQHTRLTTSGNGRLQYAASPAFQLLPLFRLRPLSR
jgi:hypothetical protein